MKYHEILYLHGPEHTRDFFQKGTREELVWVEDISLLGNPSTAAVELPLFLSNRYMYVILVLDDMLAHLSGQTSTWEGTVHMLLKPLNAHYFRMLPPRQRST